MRIPNYMAIRKGLKLYDEVNGRTITITNVSHYNDCVTTEVAEPEYDEDGNEIGETTVTTLFTREEICKFDIIESSIFEGMFKEKPNLD